MLSSINLRVFSPTMSCDLLYSLTITPADPNSRPSTGFWLCTLLHFIFLWTFLDIHLVSSCLLAPQTTFVLLHLVSFLYFFGFKVVFLWSLFHFKRKLQVISEWFLIKTLKKSMPIKNVHWSKMPDSWHK